MPSEHLLSQASGCVYLPTPSSNWTRMPSGSKQNTVRMRRCANGCGGYTAWRSSTKRSTGDRADALSRQAQSAVPRSHQKSLRPSQPSRSPVRNGSNGRSPLLTPGPSGSSAHPKAAFGLLTVRRPAPHRLWGAARGRGAACAYMVLCLRRCGAYDRCTVFPGTAIAECRGLPGQPESPAPGPQRGPYGPAAYPASPRLSRVLAPLRPRAEPH